MFEGRAVYWDGKEKLSYGKKRIKEVSKDKAIVRVKYCGICGTDLAIYKGFHPRSKPPLIMGHELSGKIEESKRHNKGEKVVVNPLISCGECYPCRNGIQYICQNLKLIGIDEDGGFAEFVEVAEDKIYKIPDHLDLETAALIEPFATGAHALRVADPKKDDLILVLGGGPIGLAIALFLKHSGFENIIISEISSFRKNLLKGLGLNIVNPLEKDLKMIVMEESNGKLADIVIEATGAAKPSFDMTSYVRVRGIILLVGISHRPPMVKLMDVVFKELTISGIRVYSDDDFRDSIDFVADNKNLLKKYISKTLPLDKFKEALVLAGDSEKAMKVVINV